MKHLALIVSIGCVTALGIASVLAESFNWENAENGVSIGQALAFPGCAPSTSITDQKARKVAILKAQARIARTRSITVSGEEHSKTQQGGDNYKMTVVEVVSSYLRPVTVVREEITNIDGIQNLCVLVVEKTNEK